MIEQLMVKVPAMLMSDARTGCADFSKSTALGMELKCIVVPKMKGSFRQSCDQR